MPKETDVHGELEALNLEKMRREVAILRGDENLRKVRRKSVELSLRSERERDENRHASCWHRKGGNGVENLYRGNDNNYAVVKHILPTGEVLIVCQRCGCEWMPPDRALIAKGATAEDRKLYALEMAEYRKAIAFPTDNSTSGSQIFLISETAQQVMYA
jgi:hypothetical protein